MAEHEPNLWPSAFQMGQPMIFHRRNPGALPMADGDRSRLRSTLPSSRHGGEGVKLYFAKLGKKTSPAVVPQAK